MTKQDLLNKIEELTYETNNESIQHSLADVYNHIKEFCKDYEDARDYILSNVFYFNSDIRPYLFWVIRG